MTNVNEYYNELPKSYGLEQNYPNPFSQTTTFSFMLPESDIVSLKIYDLQGREVTTLLDEKLNAGEHSVTFNAKGLQGGIYFYRFSTSNFSQTKKMEILK